MKALTFPPVRGTRVPSTFLFTFAFFIIVILFSESQAQTPTLDWNKNMGVLIPDWTRPKLAVDPFENLFVSQEVRSGGHIETIRTIKISPSEHELWTNFFDGDNFLRAIGSDHEGNFIMLLSLTSSAPRGMVKYSPSGVSIWNHEIGIRDTLFSDFKNIVVDKESGDFYTVGQLGYLLPSLGERVVWGNRSFHIERWNSEGIFEWERIIDPYRGIDVPFEAIRDNAGNILIAGAAARINNPSGPSPGDQTVLKLSETGDLLVESYVNFGISRDTVTSADESLTISYDELGNIYTTGHIYSTPSVTGDDGDEFMTVSAFDPLGNLSWQRIFANYDSYDVLGWFSSPFIKAYKSSAVYLAYDSARIIKLEKMDASGSTIWKRSITSIDSLRLVNLSLDVHGNIFLGINAEAEHNYISVYKYNPDGELNWHINYSSSSAHYSLTHLFINNSGNFYVTGFRDIDGIGRNVFINRYVIDAPVLPGIIPRDLIPYENYFVSVFADQEPGWCWNEIIIDFPCFQPPFCGEEEFQSSLKTVNNKTLWSKDFMQPIHETLPAFTESASFNLGRITNNQYSSIIRLEDDLVSAGIESIKFEFSAKNNTIHLTANSFDDKPIEFAMDFLNDKGEIIFQKTLVAPVDIEISEQVDEQVESIEINSVLSKNAMLYYPNPFSGTLTVDIGSKDFNPGEIKILSLTGNVLWKKMVDKPGQFNVILSNQKPGMYILIFQAGNSEQKELIELK